jgi:hypothetical protein
MLVSIGESATSIFVTDRALGLPRQELPAGSSPVRALLSSTGAPRIGNRFMKFTLDKGQYYQPGAPSRAFAFMSVFMGDEN